MIHACLNNLLCD